jgi:hypothetical protein
MMRTHSSFNKKIIGFLFLGIFIVLLSAQHFSLRRGGNVEISIKLKTPSEVLLSCFSPTQNGEWLKSGPPSSLVSTPTFEFFALQVRAVGLPVVIEIRRHLIQYIHINAP